MNEKKGGGIRLAIDVGGLLLALLAVIMGFVNASSVKDKETSEKIGEHSDRLTTLECITGLTPGCERN
jgi:hypothetical protein